MFGLSLDRQYNTCEPLGNSYKVFSLRQLKKRNLDKHTEICLEFLFFFLEAILTKEKQKREKLFTCENSQQAKEETRNLFGVSFNTTN